MGDGAPSASHAADDDSALVVYANVPRTTLPIPEHVVDLFGGLLHFHAAVPAGFVLSPRSTLAPRSIVAIPLRHSLRRSPSLVSHFVDRMLAHGCSYS